MKINHLYVASGTDNNRSRDLPFLREINAPTVGSEQALEDRERGGTRRRCFLVCI